MKKDKIREVEDDDSKLISLEAPFLDQTRMDIENARYVKREARQISSSCSIVATYFANIEKKKNRKRKINPSNVRILYIPFPAIYNK